jgi:signal transduction histidine kinase
MMSSLRRRLIWTLLAMTLFVWLLSGIFTSLSVERALQQQIDQQLRQYSHLVTYISRVFARQIDEGLPLYETWSENPLEALRRRPMVVDAPGTGQGLTPVVNIWLNEKMIALMAGSPRFERPTEEGFSDIEEGEDGLRWRVLTRYDEVSDLWIRVGVDFSAARGTMLTTLGLELWPLLILLPLTIAALYLGVSRGLLPLDALAGQIARRKPGVLDPVPTEGVPRELAGVIGETNKLMERLAFALEGEQRFTANAAHELLTPLAAIKAEVQLCQRMLADDSGGAMLDRIARRVDRASHSVEQLLILARLDPDTPLPVGPVHLQRLLAEVLADTAHLAADRGLEVDLEESGAPVVEGNAEALAILLRNLLSNAFRYAVEGSVVTIGLRAEEGIELEICNDCTPLSREEFARLSDRFYRVPGSAGPGTGLGLSIVSRIADLHRARFRARPREEKSGFCASVHFPADPGSAGS